MLDISQGSTITIESQDTLEQCTFIGEYISSDKKHGYSEKITIYGRVNLKYSAMVEKGTVSVEFIDFDNKEVLRSFNRLQSRINITDQDNKIISGMLILGDELSFSPSYDDDDGTFYTTNFEVRR